MMKIKKHNKVKIHCRVEIEERICPFCKGTDIVRNHKKMRTKLLFDLKVMRHGMKGQVIAYTGAQHQCLGCKRNFQIPSDLVVKSQATDIIDLLLQLARHPNGVHRSCHHRKSRGTVLSTSAFQWATTKFDGVCEIWLITFQVVM